jgi:ADP-heptose:LPS heptosyltransferase
MQVSRDILGVLEKRGAQMAKEAQRAVILQPGALGDCILTLPLAKLMQEQLGLGGVDIIGHAEYVGILPERSCVDSIRSIDSTGLHRLFVEPAEFDLEDRDPLINALADYSWIVTFMGEPDGKFEQNLIFTANCSHSAEVISLSLKPPNDSKQHIAEFYAQQFAQESGLPAEQMRVPVDEVTIRVTAADRARGLELLDQAGADVSKRLMVIHPGSGGRPKCWHLENFVGVAEALRAMDIEALFLTGPVETERLSDSEKACLHDAAPCVADLALAQVVAVLSCADAFVGNDSGVTHLAAGMGLRTSVLFGPTDPTVYRPIGPALTVFQGTEDHFAEASDPELQRAVVESLTAPKEEPTAS